MMNRLLRTVVLTPLAVSPLLLGPAVTAYAAPAAPAAAAAAAVHQAAPGHSAAARSGATAGTDPDAQYDKGFRKGFQAVRADCGAEPPRDLPYLGPDYRKGYEDGAALAAKTFCGGG